MNIILPFQRDRVVAREACIHSVPPTQPRPWGLRTPRQPLLKVDNISREIAPASLASVTTSTINLTCNSDIQ
jgi:hypothetical protein